MGVLSGFDITVTTADGDVLRWSEFSDATEESIRREYEVLGNKVDVKPTKMEFTAGVVGGGLLVDVDFEEVE